MKNKRPKRELGISMQSPSEKKRKGLFGSFRYSQAWETRGQAIRDRVKKRVARVKIRKAERELALKEGRPVVYTIK